MMVLKWTDSQGFVHKVAVTAESALDHIEALDRLGYMWEIKERHTDANVNSYK